MKTDKRKTELQISYQALVDSVEEFVVKEGKTLQQAFHAAEEKLHDAKEISKEKIQQASKDLKQHLRLLGETVEGVSEAYKNQVKFDLTYVNNSIWHKLQYVANSNTADLMAFTRTLKEKAQTVITEDHLVAHQEHIRWASEHALWLDEVDFWKKDQQQAMSKLMDIEKALNQQSTALFEHAQVIQALGNIDNRHEKVMANAEHDPSSDVFKFADESQVTLHQKETQLHGQHSESHHLLKTQHYKIMAMINALYKEINKAK